jgi:hypothetical protein
MVDKIESQEDMLYFMKERALMAKLREAIGFCKNLLEINATTDKNLKYEERMNMEKCLTENFLVKHGYDYFGKRDLIYLDLMAPDDIKRLRSD